MKTALLVTSLLFVTLCYAQHKKAYQVKVGEIPNQALPREAMYLSPEFKNGMVQMRDGSNSSLKLNYNFLQDEMHFLASRGDTLAIADPALIRAVTIDSFTFYYDHGFLRELSRVGGYRLTVKQQMVQQPDKTRGGYDAPSGTSAIQTYGRVIKESGQYALRIQKDVLFEETRSYYIGKKSNSFLKANKKNFHLLFPDKDISRFVLDHKTDFRNTKDLQALLKFCVD